MAALAISELDALTLPDRELESPPPVLQTTFDCLIQRLSAQVRANDEAACAQLQEAINYSLQTPGKCVRGHLLLLTSEAWGADWQTSLDCAAAVEIVHTASLIMDDLPAMDDATVRRGKTASHLRFDQPTALLATISLLSDAFAEIANSTSLSADRRCQALAALAGAVGTRGMAGGQHRDLFPPEDNMDNLELTHAMKTGSLFAASAEIGSIAAGIGGPRRWMMRDFGTLLGKAFQQFDDLLDRHSAVSAIGKDVGKDQFKPTIVRLVGREEAEHHALRHTALALECLEASGAAHEPLRTLVISLIRSMRSKIMISPDTA